MIYRIGKFNYVNLRNVNYIINTDEHKVDQTDGKIRIRIYVNFACGGCTNFYLTPQELEEFQQALECYGVG